MAVSFAPAASLNVFANPANKDAVGNETIDATGSYTLVSSTAVTVNSTATGTVNIDLNGQNVTVTIASGNKANVALYDTDGIRDTTKAGDVRYATLTVSGESNTPSLSISGNVNTKAVNPTGLKGTDNVAATGTQPVALIGGVYYVGNKAINTATDGQNISAVNGAVVIDELDDGKSATIVSGANHDTSIKVTATSRQLILIIRVQAAGPAAVPIRQMPGMQVTPQRLLWKALRCLRPEVLFLHPGKRFIPSLPTQEPSPFQ